jgi:O-antigen ligase
VAVVVKILELGLLLVAIVGSIYSALPPQNRGRISIGLRVSLLAWAAFFIIDAITKSDDRWLDVAGAVFAVGGLVFQAVWDRRRKGRSSAT